MTENPTHPYTLEIRQGPGGHFQWAIRDRGKLVQRSDRSHASEAEARRKGEAAIESLFVKTRNDRFR